MRNPTLLNRPLNNRWRWTELSLHYYDPLQYCPSPGNLLVLECSSVAAQLLWEFVDTCMKINMRISWKRTEKLCFLFILLYILSAPLSEEQLSTNCTTLWYSLLNSKKSSLMASYFFAQWLVTSSLSYRSKMSTSANSGIYCFLLFHARESNDHEELDG